MRTPKGKTGIEMFREYFQLQQSAPLSAVEQSIMTHIIWLMNENLSEEVQITLRQLSARSNVDVRTLKAKLPQLCNKNYLKYAEIEGEVCKVAYKNVSKSGTIPSFQPPNKLINKDNIIKGEFNNVGKSEPSISVGGNGKCLSLADL